MSISASRVRSLARKAETVRPSTVRESAEVGLRIAQTLLAMRATTDATGELAAEIDEHPELLRDPAWIAETFARTEAGP